MVLPPLAIAVAAGGGGVSISLGESALALFLLPLVLVAILWLTRNRGAHAEPREPALPEQYERPEGLVAPARMRRRALGWGAATLVSLVLTAYLTRGWAAGVGTVLFFTIVVTIVIRYPCWWTFRLFAWALRFTLRTAREARSVAGRLAAAGLGLLLLPGLLFFGFWAFVFPVLFFYAWGSSEQRLARATPVLADAVATVWPEEIRVRGDDDGACRLHVRLADEFDDLSPRYCVVGADSQAVLVVAKLMRSEAAARRFRLSAVERRYGGATEGTAVVLYPLPPGERAREAATAAARAAAALDEFG